MISYIKPVKNQQLMMAAAAAAGQQQGGPAGTGQAQANLTHAGLVGQQLGLPQNQQVCIHIFFQITLKIN